MTTRPVIRAAVLAALAALVLAPLAAAHAELDPGEAPAGSFQRFVLHIPNESDTASTVKVAVRFPESVATATFVRVPGWTRTVTTLMLDQPTTDAEGNEIDERIVTVTWEGGTIDPGETGEFPFSFEAPDQPGATIFFPTVQTYSDGSVSRWIGAPGSDQPAPAVLIAEGTGGEEETTTAEETQTEPAPAETVTETATIFTTPETTTAAVTPAAAEDDGDSNLPLILGLLLLLAALGALGYWFYRRDKSGPPPPPGSGGPPPPPDEQVTQRFNPPL